MEYPHVSVIIPVYNDADRLQRCLRALEAQTYPSDRYEVIVVDNASDESIEPLVAQFPQAKAEFESQRGSYAARNRGVKMARGDVLAFTDADCVPAPTWMEAGVSRLDKDANIGAVGGRIVMSFKEGHPTPVELVDAIISLNQEKNCKQGYAVTANVFVRQSMVEEIGTFNARLKSGGDVEWTRRISAAGYDVVFGKDAAVEHPARHRYRDLRKKKLRVSKGYHDMQTAQGYPFSAWMKDVMRFMKPPIRTLYRVMSDDRLPAFSERLRASWVFTRIWGIGVRQAVGLRFLADRSTSS
jgi:glycosyltransferase involved in cell wall biosynthesis